MASVGARTSRRAQKDNARQLVLLLQTMDKGRTENGNSNFSEIGVSRESKDFHNAMLRLSTLEMSRRNREEMQSCLRRGSSSDADSLDGEDFPLDNLSQTFEGCVQQCWMMYRDDVTKHLEMELESLLLSTREECQRVSNRLALSSSN